MNQKKLTIEEWRKAKGMSREALAAGCEVSVTTIRNWEAKPSTIDIRKAFRIAEVFQVSILDIDFGT